MLEPVLAAPLPFTQDDANDPHGYVNRRFSDDTTDRLDGQLLTWRIDWGEPTSIVGKLVQDDGDVPREGVRMPIERSNRPVAVTRIVIAARQLLSASTLCAIATVSTRGRAHINTAYFAWTPELHCVWLSDPDAMHSRNVRMNSSVAIAVYDSRQSWDKPDRGIQLFGSAREVEGRAVRDAETVYTRRFPECRRSDLSAYRFYRFRPRRIKLFDEAVLGEGTFVTASIGSGRRIAWERTEIYHSNADLAQNDED